MIRKSAIIRRFASLEQGHQLPQSTLTSFENLPKTKRKDNKLVSRHLSKLQKSKQQALKSPLSMNMESKMLTLQI